MFIPERWATAFIHLLATQGGEAEEGLTALRTLASWVKSLPGAVFGSSAAERLEKLIRDGLKSMPDFSPQFQPEGSNLSFPAMEAALRLVVLMVKKNAIRHIDEVIDEIKKILDKKNGIVQVSVEHALPEGFPPGDGAERIKDAIKKQTGAVRVDITERVNPELIGGYRLRIGDEIIDASVRSQLRELETSLAAAGIFAHGGN